MQVAADGIPINRAFGAVASVVAATDADPSHRLGPGAESGQPAVVFEPDQFSPSAVDHDIADESLRPGNAGRVEQPDPWQRFGGVRPVLMAEKLVTTAHGEHGCAIFHRRPKRRALRAL